MAPPNHHYDLPLDVLLGNLQDLRASGLLQTHIPDFSVKGRRIREPCLVQMRLEKGEVRQCIIFLQNGGLFLKEDEAWNALRQFADHKLVWQFTQERLAG